MMITIGKLGTITNRTTIVYDKNNENIYELEIPYFPVDTTIIEVNGKWQAICDGLPKEVAHRLKQSEEFYYATRKILKYKDYLEIVKKYPTNCYTKWIENPFYLSDLIRPDTDIPYVAVNEIDKNIIISTFDIRLKEMKAIMYNVLLNNENAGHTWMDIHKFYNVVNYMLKQNGHPLLSGGVLAYLNYYVQSGDFYFEKNRVAIMATYRKEKDIYNQVKLAMQSPSIFHNFQHIWNNGLSDEQNEAVRDIVLKGGNFTILTGGPGTGKTTILKETVDKVLEQFPDTNIYLLSPTGKATRRIKEVFGDRDIEINTVHKFLGFGHILTRKEIKKFQEADLVIVDESSMLDLNIFDQLLVALNTQHTKVILVGDVDQLPSIGAGNILSDLISLGVYTKRLTTNFRSVGNIVNNAIKINTGRFILNYGSEFKLIETPKCVADFMAGMSVTDEIVITPYRVSMSRNNKKLYGSSQIVNGYVQKKKLGTIYNTFNIGDVIIFNRTNYKLGYYNGEMGTIINKNNYGEYIIDLEDRMVTVTNTNDMDLGYAISVHKSQGSEHPKWILVIPEFNEFITRRMLYTAITRAREGLEIYSTSEIIRKIIYNNREEGRNTFLGLFEKLAKDSL